MPPALVSHRTNAGDAPENTLVGIEAAIRDHCDAIGTCARRATVRWCCFTTRRWSV